MSELKEKGLLVESQGAQVIDLEEYNMPPCLITKSSGRFLVGIDELCFCKLIK